MYSPLESLKVTPRFSQDDEEYASALAKFNDHAQSLQGLLTGIAQNYFTAKEAGLDSEVALGKMGLLLKGHRRLFHADKKPKSFKGWRENNESRKSLHRMLLQYEIDRDGMNVFDKWLKSYEKNARAFFVAENKVEVSQQSVEI